MKLFFKKRKPLRDKCIEAYGEEFGKIYDNLCKGIPVGGFVETAIILQMVEDVKTNKI
jgi:hypothetical protein